MTATTEAHKCITYSCPNCQTKGYLVMNSEHPTLLPNGVCHTCKRSHTARSLLKYYIKLYKNRPIPTDLFNAAGLMFICEMCAAPNIVTPILVMEDRLVQYAELEDGDKPSEKRDAIRRDSRMYKYPDMSICLDCGEDHIIEVSTS